MRDPQKLIDDIDGFLGRSDQTLTDDVRGLVDEFNVLCGLADSRLRRCEDYLRRGLVGEAIHLAEVEPAVLDIVGALDFPGREQWDEVLNMYGLPVPPRVNLSRAAALNQAYELHQALEPLLKEYRRLCLSRSPLSERMAVLRELALNDPGNPSWTDDLIAYEAPALAELQASAKHARRDLAALTALAQQLQANTWSSPQAGMLMQQVQSELSALQTQQARAEFTHFGRELEQAMKQDDAVRAMNAYQALYEIWQKAALPPEDPVSQQLSRAAEWIQGAQQRQQQRAEFDQQVLAFETLLGSNRANEDNIEECYARLSRFGLPIPAPIKLSYRKAISRFQQEQDARARRWDRVLNTTLLAVAVPIALVVLAVLAVVLYRIVRAS